MVLQLETEICFLLHTSAAERASSPSPFPLLSQLLLSQFLSSRAVSHVLFFPFRSLC